MTISVLLMTSDLGPSGHGGETRGSLYGHPDSGLHRDVTLRSSSTQVFMTPLWRTATNRGKLMVYLFCNGNRNVGVQEHDIYSNGFKRNLFLFLTEFTNQHCINLN